MGGEASTRRPVQMAQQLSGIVVGLQWNASPVVVSGQPSIASPVTLAHHRTIPDVACVRFDVLRDVGGFLCELLGCFGSLALHKELFRPG